MCFGTNTTNPVCDSWHLFRGASDRKLLEAAEFWDLKISIGYISFFIEEDLNLSVTL
jgi:hypothetical protein